MERRILEDICFLLTRNIRCLNNFENAWNTFTILYNLNIEILKIKFEGMKLEKQKKKKNRVGES